jgi:putative ABC transport system ATP-binding protein
VAEPVIRCRGLAHFFGEGEARKPALLDVSLDLAPGEVVILTGPSGSGKTTLLTLAGALRRVQEGELTVLGRDLARLSARELVRVRREIGFIFQLHNLFPALSALANVRMALELQSLGAREQEEEARRLLERLGLGHRLHHKPQRLSGGERQRVAIARALATHPRLVLADEPTAALDREAGRCAIELLQERARTEGAAVVIVTHDARILDAADRIVNLVDGGIASDVRAGELAAVCQVLRRIPAFGTHTAASLVEIAQQMRPERRAAGEDVIREGEAGDRFYVLREGSVEVLKAEGGASRTVALLAPGDFFGESALLSGAPRNATIRAREPVALLGLGKEQFLDAVRRCPAFEEELRRVMSQRG